MIKKYQIGVLATFLILCWVLAFRSKGNIENYQSTALLAQRFWFERIYRGDQFDFGPLSLVLLQWMPVLSHPTIQIILILINTIAFVIFWVALLKLYPVLEGKQTKWFWIFIWVVSILPIVNNFASHSWQLLLAALILLGELLMKHRLRRISFLSGWGFFWFIFSRMVAVYHSSFKFFSFWASH